MESKQRSKSKGDDNDTKKSVNERTSRKRKHEDLEK